MSKNSITEPQYLLRKAMSLYGRDLVQRYAWVWETDRWKELVFALLVQVSPHPENRVRELVAHLDELHLLDISALASICVDGKRPDLTAPLAQQFLDFLEGVGYSKSVAERGLTTVCQAALAFQSKFGGKLQRYLRSYGEPMLKDLDGVFQFTCLTGAQTRDAFVLWLQNVLNMPLSLVDKNMHDYCQLHGLTTAQLVEAADELNLNLAVLDDLIALWVENRPKDAKPKRTGPSEKVEKGGR